LKSPLNNPVFIAFIDFTKHLIALNYIVYGIPSYIIPSGKNRR